MALQIIGAGFGRTGTTSLKIALEELGFTKCYHMRELIAHPSHATVWLDAYEGKKVNWDSIFGGYRAILDWPGSYFYKELGVAYPDAKVVLSVRDPEKWYDSMLKTIHTESQSVPRWALWLVPPVRRLFQVMDRVIWEGVFQGRFTDKGYVMAVFHRHIEEVKGKVPAHKLLIYDVKEGWEPLCQFLEVPVPNIPFPRSNDQLERKQLLRRRWTIIGGALTIELLLVVAVVTLLVKLLQGLQ